MDENTNVTTPTTTTTILADSMPSSGPVITPEHISALHRHIEQVKDFLIGEFHKVVAFVQKEAPAVEAGAAAVAAAVPGLASVAAAVEKVAATAAGFACICTCNANHTPKGCTAPGCPCKAPNTLARPATT